MNGISQSNTMTSCSHDTRTILAVPYTDHLERQHQIKRYGSIAAIQTLNLHSIGF